jgi:hypothetical protein
VFSWRNLPKIGGIVKADAIAKISRKKNKPNADPGNFFTYPFPNLWVSALSLTSDNDVLTKNVSISFDMEGYIHDTLI